MDEFVAERGDQSPYLCAECREPVFVLPNGRIYKPCGHDEAEVLANLDLAKK